MTKYSRKTLHEHVLTRPSVYIGNVVSESAVGKYVYDGEKIVQVESDSDQSWSSAFVKVFDEILSNATDATAPGKRICVTLDEEITVLSQSSIPVVKHDTEDCLIPELIFGSLLTSSNYDDEVDRTVAGQNGVGAKATNIFSTRFKVKVRDADRGKEFEMTWKDNMTKKSDAKIKTCTAKTNVVEISYVPDLQRLGMSSVRQGIGALRKRVVDAAATSHARIFLDGVEIKMKDMSAYAKLYGAKVVHCVAGNWDVAVGASSGKFSSQSFANGCVTTGGTHVDQCMTSLVDELAKMSKMPKGISKAIIRAQMALFVSVKNIVRPTFSSQMKECLTSKPTDRFVPPASFVKKVFDMLKETFDLHASEQEQKVLSKSDGKKSSRITGIPTLDDAAWAGTAKSQSCTLVVTEGLSAKTLAVSGLSVVGRSQFGIFPLKGKPLNVRTATAAQVASNAEFTHLKKIIGLKVGEVYTKENLKNLRYGRLLILADQDLDGKHVSALIINAIHSFWPSLVTLGFVQQMVTPVVKAKSERFFSERAFKIWVQGNKVQPSDVKYYKGLGTSTAAEAREYFSEINRLTLIFRNEGADDTQAMALAFGSGNADLRKNWIGSSRTVEGIPYGDVKNCTLSTFVNEELLQFSIADVKRSIPRLEDGLKPSQRKILYACFARRLTNDIKVAQLSGHVAEKTAYHHGEDSLQGCIVNMAQNYVGSNNVNLLVPQGQFGTRLANGHDAASPRYIYTRLEPVARKIFVDEDDALLDREEDDGQVIEPTFYVPVIPFVLFNGAHGIATGFSTDIPPYNPLDVIGAVEDWLEGRAIRGLKPWFRGFKGKVVQKERGGFELHGEYSVQPDKTICVTELPPGRSTSAHPKVSNSFVDVLQKLLERGVISDFVNKSSDVDVMFVIKGYTGTDPAKDFQLIERKRCGEGNMHLVTDRGVELFSDVRDIVRRFCEVRMALYEKRLGVLVTKLEAEIREKEIYLDWVVSCREIGALSKAIEEVEVELDPARFPPELRPALWKVPISEFNAQKVERREKNLQRLREELELLRHRTPRDLWLWDILDLRSNLGA